MSHNQLKVSGQSPNVNGEINLALDDISNVSASSPAQSDTLIYNSISSSFELVPFAGLTLALFGTGASQSYPTTGSAIANGVALNFYGVAYNGVGATVGSGWFDSFTLPAGDYILNAVSGVTMSTSGGAVTYRWYNGTSYLGTTGNVGYETDTVGSPAMAYVTLSSSTSLSVVCTSATNVNTLASQGNRAAEYSFIEIRKLA